NGGIEKTPPHIRCQNLDEFGIPSHDKVPFRLYKDPLQLRHPMTLVSCSRGCINSCNHCLSVFQKPLRYRSLENVLKEMRLLKNLGIREIKFFDCALTNDIKWANNFFKALIDERFNFSWTCNARADSLPPDTLRLMKQAGCHTICIGSESANQEILEKMGKNIKISDIESSVRNIKKLKMRVLMYFTFGLIGETHRTMRQSIEFAKRLNPDLVTFGIVVPVWGTRFYDYLDKNKYLMDVDISLYDPNNPPVYNYPHLSSYDIYQTSLKGYREFYLRPSFILKRLTNNPFNIRSHISNLIIFIKRYLLS
ncbi:MAG: radical SAM protein, partial [Candidatus Omnitrophica bacterium]|nr:radical SAM protein [Candidatus Omnitrophota bacterium]